MFLAGAWFTSMAVRVLWSCGRRLLLARAARPRGLSAWYTSFWRWQTTVAYLAVLWVVDRLMTRLGVNLHAQPDQFQFVVFGLGLGLALTLLERAGEMGRHGQRRRVKKPGGAP
jgi:hypothetical protein